MKNIRDKTRRQFITTGALATLGTIRALGAVHTHPEGSPGAQLHSGLVTVNLSEKSNAITLQSSSTRRTVLLEATVEGYSPRGRSVVRELHNGVLERQSEMADLAHGEHCVLFERVSLGSSGSIHWELDIHSAGVLRTSPIHMIARYPATEDARFWTAWSDPSQPSDGGADQEVKEWKDPLTLKPLAKRRFFYGAPYFTYENPRIGFCPVYRDLMAIPLASFLEPKTDTGFSMIVSPDTGDGLLDLTLDTDQDGTADFTFHYHRLNAQHPVRLAADLISHEADWRGGLRWATSRYPRYFTPKLVTAQALDGTAAYSMDGETDFDPAILRKMAFRVNWKASFDFPYMGMFLPPLATGAWPRFSGDSGGSVAPGPGNRNGFTSIKQMADYSKKMRDLGFYVLNYFNVTEFGAGIVYPPPPRVILADSDLWKNTNDFLYNRLANAILHVPSGIPEPVLKMYPGTKVGGPYYTWGGGIVLDCGAADYEHFLLQQAQFHIDKLPSSSGICIDRMDWLRLYNDRRDDGVSCLTDKPVMSLYISWKRLMAKLLPMMHGAGKVVFVNNHVKRFDLLLDIDGIFDEFAINGGSLNLTALLGVSRPALGWTNDEEAIRGDPDNFFQRFLYMGVFPMAPFPGNDHSILPSAWANHQYLEYGPLLNVMHGRTWILEPHAVEVPGDEAVANVFSVPDGYAIPVMLGGDRHTAKVSVDTLAGMKLFKAEALHPGGAAPIRVEWSRAQNRIIFDVPLVRGCAMLRIQVQR